MPVPRSGQLGHHAQQLQHRGAMCRPCSKARARPSGKDGKGEGGGGGGEASNPASQPILEIPSITKPSRPVERSSYRRRANEEEVLQNKLAARKELTKRSAQVDTWSEAIRTNTGPRGRPSLPSLMLVDGYNVLHRDPKLRDMFNRNTLMARAELEQWVHKYASAARIHCLLVWDAMGGGRAKNTMERVSSRVTVVYAARSEADTLIVAKAQQAHKQGAYKVVVVSGDNRIQMELADEDNTFIMLDTDKFVQHLRQAQAGNTSEAESWRSFWRRPQQLSPTTRTAGWDNGGRGGHRPGQQHQGLAAPGSGGDGGSESDSDDVAESQAVQALMGSQELEQELIGIVQQAQERQEGGQLSYAPGSAYLQSFRATAPADADADVGTRGGLIRKASLTDDDDDDDDDLDRLLKLKI